MTTDQARALDATLGLPPTPKNVERVAAVLGEDLARWAFTQWELRKKARQKFALADEMLFDRDGLEMASHERVAGYHASHFATGSKVADLACGVGGDLIALARRGPVVGYETDPVRAAYARHNLAVHGLEGNVVEADADVENVECDSVYVDPQRRGREGFGDPDPRVLLERKFGTVVAKLGTGLDPDQVRRELFPYVEAVSFGGECKELLAIAGEGEGVFAHHVESGERLESSHYPPTADQPGDFLFHADPAAIKARCLGALCTRHGLEALGDSDGYLTGTVLVVSPWLRAYRVLDHGTADRKRTQAAIAALQAQIAEVKTRGTREPAAAIKRQFKPVGPRQVVLAVWPVGRSLRHTLVEPITNRL